MSVIVGFLLTLASVSLKDMQQANIKLDKQKKILKSLGIMEKEREYKKEEILEIYASNVKELYLNKDNSLSQTKQNEDSLKLYAIYKDDKIYRYAIHFSAYGLWSYIKGYIGLKGDGNTISGFTVYSHGETPGLGAEVDNDKWKDLWPGKQIYQNNDVALKVIKGKVESDDAMVTYKVDGLSGATLTSRGVSNMIEYWFSESGYSSMLKELDYES
jgi:Na+-transporting NADH:ubiquinone oxidoreductase subunit C